MVFPPIPRPTRRCFFCALRLEAQFSTYPPRRRQPSVRTVKKVPVKRSSLDRPPSTPRRTPQSAQKLPNLGCSGLTLAVGLNRLHDNLENDQALQKFAADGVKLRKLLSKFTTRIQNAVESNIDDELVREIREGFSNTRSIDERLKRTFYNYALSSQVSKEALQGNEQLGDLRHPAEWFPATRAFQREFHVHVGPTNSGKTYHALKRLESAEKGLYAGPLRLLAHEVFMRLNARGQRCNLVTGDDRRSSDDDPNAPHISCTVEMVPLNAQFDVAVIDEIQMIGSSDRGWAWTQAVLGVLAKEVHLCGEERAVPIVQELAAACGERVHIHRYQRLNPLSLARRSLHGDLAQLQKGDCVVGFSIVVLHSIRKKIEEATGKQVALIYGSLPPETRAQQAQLFNDDDNDYDYLVASNAVGMGLNLNIKRMIFLAVHRQIKGKWENIPSPEIKQIAGRAGRFSTASSDMKRSDGSCRDNPDSSAKRPGGIVTTLDAFDHPALQKAMNEFPEPITSAGIFPPSLVVERFAKYFPPRTPFSYLLTKLYEFSKTVPRYFLCDLKTNLSIADAIEIVDGLTTSDRMIFCSAPIEPRKPGEAALARAFARNVAESQEATVLDYHQLDIELLEDEYEPNAEYLARVEGLHKGLITFLWLSYRYSGIFIDRELAIHVKEMTEKRIEDTLAQLAYDYDKIRRSRERAIIDLLGNEDGEAKIDSDGETTNPDQQIEADQEANAEDVTKFGGDKYEEEDQVSLQAIENEYPPSSDSTRSEDNTRNLDPGQLGRVEGPEFYESHDAIERATEGRI
ncbi:MAG: RNA helicase [Alyxoria varia]|nr:MAG: RNA helicase [Alyxoria varia]